MIEKMKASIEEKYGQPFDAWVDLLKAQNLEKHGAMIKWLKSEHGFSHGFANLVAHSARESAALHQPTSDLIEGQYKGKEHLRPWYETIVDVVKTLGDDVEIAPKKSYVSLRRKKQFALVQPSTKSRLDVGINLKGKSEDGPLESSGSWNTMVSHRVKITDLNAINDDLKNWLKEAYEQAG